MSDYGVQLRNDSDSVIWDSRTVPGGIVAEVLSYTANQSDTRTYPHFAGRNGEVYNVTPDIITGPIGVTFDTALGYPRVTVSATSYLNRNFMVLIY